MGQNGTCLISYELKIREACDVINHNIYNHVDIKKFFKSEIGRLADKILNKLLNFFRKRRLNKWQR